MTDKPDNNGPKVGEVQGQPVVFPTFSKFPMDKWVQWEQDCKAKYNDCRWLKAWTDHMKTAEDEKYVALLRMVQDLQLEIEQIKQTLSGPQEPVETGIKTIGGQIHR